MSPVSRIGVDTGGTFTDFVHATPDGLRVEKRRSTPADPSVAILEGVASLSAGHGTPDVVHGSTVATNAVLERKGARVALVATAGFEDVLRIGRQTRPALYDIQVPAPRPLVDPALTFGVIERLDADGRVIEPVDAADLDRLVVALRPLSIDIVAVCLLHAYANPAHEQQVASRLRAEGLMVCASHEVLPEYREYERWSTTVLNAYVTPLMDRYLGALERELRGRRLSIMQSNGGSISAGAARAQAVRTVLSGPAAGVVGARAVAHAAGFPRVISFDMGGTSTDVCLIDGAASMTAVSAIGDFPLRVPVIDIHTVGAGGGSIATVDAGGALRVGPESAGARPGPACYGEGTSLTVTDANLLLGRLDADLFLGGRMSLDVSRARAAAEPLARTLKLSVAALAEGVIRVANANMERAIRVVSVERGHDPRRFALLAFGGAGGMHAADLARALEIGTVVVPRHAGVLSALGMLVADVTRDYSASVLRPSRSIDRKTVDAVFASLTKPAAADLSAEGFSGRRQTIERLVDVRYVGQAYEITVPWTPGFERDFHTRHQRTFGYSNAERPTEVVNVRVRASGLVDKPRFPRVTPRRHRVSRPAGKRTSRATAGRGLPVIRWEALSPGAFGSGPVVIAGAEATVVVPATDRFHVDGFGNVILTIARGRR